jgi:hypothetical protein
MLSMRPTSTWDVCRQHIWERPRRRAMVFSILRHNLRMSSRLAPSAIDSSEREWDLSPVISSGRDDLPGDPCYPADSATRDVGEAPESIGCLLRTPCLHSSLSYAALDVVHWYPLLVCIWAARIGGSLAHSSVVDTLQVLSAGRSLTSIPAVRAKSLTNDFVPGAFVESRDGNRTVGFLPLRSQPPTR